MQQLLHKFLVLHRKLSIPGLGSFTIDNESARADVPTGLLFPPRPVIHFGESPLPVADEHFFHFLSEQMGVDEVTAVKEFNVFSARLANDITEHNQALFPGVGRVIKGSGETLFFTPESNLMELLPPIQLDETFRTSSKKATAVIVPRKQNQEPEAKPVPVSVVVPLPEVHPEPGSLEAILEEYEEEEETEYLAPDRWWIYAILLLGAGVAGLWWYYR